MKKITVGNPPRSLPFTDDESSVQYVDVLTERRLREGVVHLGFGQFITGSTEEEDQVRNVIYLRLSVDMAYRLGQALVELKNPDAKLEPPTERRRKAN